MVDLRKANPCDHIRFVISALLLLFSMVVTSYAIVTKKTSFWDAVPGWAALLIFIVDLFLLGIVEGLQIALVELKRQHPDSYKKSHPRAYHVGQMASRGDNVERFLMGRQVSVVVLVFFAAKMTTIHAENADQNGFLFPVPGWFQAAFLETGFISCIVVVILAQLMPQIVAAKYPVHFLEFIIMRPAYFACIFLEMTGLTHICWCLAAGIEKAAHMEDDETTMNPNDTGSSTEGTVSDCQTLNKVHASLEEVSVDTEQEGSAKYKIKCDDDLKDLSNSQFYRFGQLVDKLNSTISPEGLRVLCHYLNTHPEKFNQFPSVIGNKLYPAPHALAEHMAQDGHDVPRFLTDISHPNHIPPHIVACELLAKNRELQEEINFLQAKLNHM